ncbi:unnamed protein product [Adineta ricciae]|uniref:Aminoglycoside phosphotransferase domain-containing protein n=1 Tax=Adineta ricciae TaxID=249248 RepID=A0A815RU49_ADIRI|nr:unnamed protein product [Adineta ricciae]
MKVEVSGRFEGKYGHFDWECVTIGESNADVYRTDQFVLKKQMIKERTYLSDEKSRIEWLKGKASVPYVVDYDRDERFEYLLMTRLIGTDAAQTKWTKQDPKLLVHQLGVALHHLHETIPITDCPFDMRLINQAKDRHDFKELISHAPDEDLVFTHGDYCLPNIIFDDNECRAIGFVDLGRAGIADRYYDIAVGLWSIQYNLGDGFREIFLNAYGIHSDVDEKKIEFYQKLESLL